MSHYKGDGCEPPHSEPAEEPRQTPGHSDGAPRRETHGHFVGKERDDLRDLRDLAEGIREIARERIAGLEADNATLAAINEELHTALSKATDAMGDVVRLANESHDEAEALRADVARLEGERDALREALLWAQEAIGRWIPNPSEFDKPELAAIADGRASIRAALAKGGAQ